MERLPNSIIDVADNQADNDLLLKAASVVIKHCQGSKDHDLQRMERQSKADVNRILDNYPDNHHRDDQTKLLSQAEIQRLVRDKL